MTKDVVGKHPPITKVNSAEEGLLVSLNQLGKVDLPFIGSLYGKPRNQVIAELGDLIFPDPELQSWQTADAYLSGNVRAKLAHDSLRVEVVDHGGGRPARGHAAHDAERSRGLTVVSELATRWGVVMEPEWKSVWFELRCPRSPSRRERRLLLDTVASHARHFIRRLPRP